VISRIIARTNDKTAQPKTCESICGSWNRGRHHADVTQRQWSRE